MQRSTTRGALRRSKCFENVRNPDTLEYRNGAPCDFRTFDASLTRRTNYHSISHPVARRAAHANLQASVFAAQRYRRESVVEFEGPHSHGLRTK